MEHPDWAGFLAAIIADPNEDTARLVAADFLEEYGDADRAAFIRIQVELARLEATGLGKSLEADHLRAKERSFLGPLSLFRQLWAAEDCPELVRATSQGNRTREAVTVEGADRVTWRRGFVEGVRCATTEWQRHGIAIRQRNPIRFVHLTQTHLVQRDDWYGMIASLRDLQRLTVADAGEGFLQWLREWLPRVTSVTMPGQ